MRSKRKWLAVLFVFIIVGLTGLYIWPVSRLPFDQLFEKVEPSVVSSLLSFRQAYPPQSLQSEGFTWEYRSIGEAPETIVFLHGMTGAYDIWWQQIDALKAHYRIIAVTYPPAQSLAALDQGLLTILQQEGVEEFNVVGTSLGGYLTQYLIARHPDRIRRAVLSNTFPPNDLIAEKNRASGALLPLLPEWLALTVFRGSFQQSIYPTSGNDELTLAFLNEIGYGRMSKAQLVGRYYCVIEKFTPPVPAIPLLIIESDNDPLVELALREQLKTTYPGAVVHTFSGAGHFPYLNRAAEYTRLLAEFMSRP